MSAQPLQWTPRASHDPTVWTIFTEQEIGSTRTFKILEEIGAGGFGKVYRAWDGQRNQTVALKVLRIVNGDSLFRFKKEFRSLGELAHPNLVSLHELLSDGERWFFTMELVDGVDFYSHVTGDAGPAQGSVLTADIRPPSRRGAVATAGHTVDEGRLRSTLRQLAEGIHALHRAGKLHRDIKPTNTLVTRDGRVKLLDFGLVTEVDPRRSLDDQVVGTVEYMAPEQGFGTRVSEATDWYSMGVMLYQALTGKLPHEGPWMEVVLEKRNTPPRPPSELAPDSPSDLCELCLRLLAADPQQRPTGAEVLWALGGENPGEIFVLEQESAALEGRDRELLTLREALATTRTEGRPLVVHVTGDRHTGKTVLVEGFLSELGHESLVLSGRCCARETMPYKALDGLMDALGDHLRRLSRLDVDRLLPPDTWALAWLFPVLKRVRSVAIARPPLIAVVPDPLERKRRVLCELRELLTRLAGCRSLVLFIDDLQWGDPTSVSLLRELLRPPGAPPLLLVLGYRDDDRSASLALRTLKKGQALTKGAEVKVTLGA